MPAVLPTFTTLAREQPYQLYVTKAILNSEHAKGMIVCAYNLSCTISVFSSGQ